jgi:hypothetical protein
MFNVILFGLLGVALSAAGVGVLTKPWEFCVILAIVMGISITARMDV